MHPVERKLGIGFLCGLFLVGAVALVRDTFYQGHDFVVFWRAAHAVLHGLPAYDLYRDGEMIFKYPPWILPALFPFGLLPLGAAKFAWGMLEVAALGSVVVWLIQEMDCDFLLSLAMTAAFWGIWAVHALDGQITLVLLAAVVWCIRARDQRESKTTELVTIVWALTAKVFSSITLLSVSSGRKFFKALGISAVVFGLLSAPAIFTAKNHSPVELYQSWKAAANSGGTSFLGEKVRGPDNQGLPAFGLRMAGIRAEDSTADLIAFAIAAILVAALFWKPSLALPEQERWLMWLGIGAAIHPLAWFHSFVFAFPLCVVTVDRAIRARSAPAIVLAVFGTACVAVLTGKTVGTTGMILQLASVKAWGVILCSVVLLGLRGVGGLVPGLLLGRFRL